MTKDDPYLNDPVLVAWFEALNQNHDENRARSLIAELVEVETYLDGRSAEPTRFQGIESVIAWMQRAPADTFVFTALGAEPTEPVKGLVAGDRALIARYRIKQETPLGLWQNHGDWTLHIEGDKVVAFCHQPNDLPQDYRESYPNYTQDHPEDDYEPEPEESQD